MFWTRCLRLLGHGLRSAKRSPRRAPSGRRAAGPLAAEQLEDRTLLSAAVWTNKPDYLPGETVTITGTGFQPGETVNLQVLHTDGTLNTGPAHAPWQVTDGGAGDPDGRADGTIQTTWVVDDDSLGSTLQVTATGLSSGETAQADFTDG